MIHSLRPSIRLLGSLVLATAPVSAGCGYEPLTSSELSITWEGCGGVFECGTLDVPLRHDDPSNGGGGFKIPVIRRPADDPGARIGSLLVNPGGPGGSGVAWARLASVLLAPELLERFDLIGSDPRGVADSDPPIDCADDLDAFIGLDLTPDDAAERQYVMDTTLALITGCSERSGEILPYVDTASAARDMDRIREALGEEEISYVGFSYGTLLGATYADLFPDRVRAFVLDGAVDPALTGEEFISGQALAFEEELDAFLDDCAARTDCKFYSGGDPAAAYDALLASIEATPMPAAGDDDGRSVGPGELWWGVSGALYSPGRWAGLASALAAASTDGDATKLLSLSDSITGRGSTGLYSNSIEQYEAILSIDSVFPSDPAALDVLTAKLASTAPRIGVYFPWSALPSVLWPLPSKRTPGPLAAKGAPPILVVGTTKDPATPYAWAVSLADQLESGALLTRNGHGHTGFAGKSACVDAVARDYLIDLEVPAPGTTCD